MALQSVTGEHFVQVGVTALRDPSGNFLPSVPIYIKTSPEDCDRQLGLNVNEKSLCADISGIFADKFRQYMQKTKKEERTIE